MSDDVNKFLEKHLRIAYMEGMAGGLKMALSTLGEIRTTLATNGMPGNEIRAIETATDTLKLVIESRIDIDTQPPTRGTQRDGNEDGHA